VYEFRELVRDAEEFCNLQLIVNKLQQLWLLSFIHEMVNYNMHLCLIWKINLQRRRWHGSVKGFEQELMMKKCFWKV
jgi:hypothetical protein